MSKITRRAFIVEEDCIGCNRCVSHCPVDCIIGAPKMLHNILEQECIGCGLCLEPCPVDCIVFKDVAVDHNQSHESMINIAKQRHKNKILRQKEQQQLFLTYQSKEEQVQNIKMEIAAAAARQQSKNKTFKIYGTIENPSQE
jgi:electron transport complex protein RnfB